MTGSLVVHERGLRDDEARYAVLTCALDDRRLFVYRDVRRLGTVWLLDDRGWAAYDARLGPEPLDGAFTAVAFAARLRGTRAAIKKAIMDQRRLVGVGNIYANEALFDARIDPSRSAARLSAEELRRLHGAIQDVLRRAIAASGTTVRDYRTGTGQAGSFQFELKVYDRAGEPCVRCGRRLATTHAIDGRQTTFCYSCQS
jgi:formamidopyrimidine-DNA glycosylase